MEKSIKEFISRPLGESQKWINVNVYYNFNKNGHMLKITSHLSKCNISESQNGTINLPSDEYYNVKTARNEIF